MKKIFKLLAYIFAPVLMLLVSTPVYASNAVLEFKHKSITDNTITTEIYLNPGGNSINGVTADFTYTSDVFEITNIDTSSSLFENFIEKDYSQEGIVYLSCYDLDGITSEGNVATITFEAVTSGDATLTFTSDAVVLEASNSTDILSEPESATYTVSEDLTTLPQTGTTEDVVTVTSIAILIALVMVITFAIAGFTIWGGVYFSLGKWEVKTEGGVELGKKGKKSKKPVRKIAKKVTKKTSKAKGKKKKK